ncbi:MAG TPA: hypothetical protein RMH99_28395 [Sandaracinaceae bacterium LLY-WYZ-13_1]|nr:hypothetical protein [Sandaracinaceae bacterium LLY-WYZ-13_1]
MSRFFRALARLSSWRFRLEHTPTIFAHLRDGPTRVRVEDAAEEVVAHYESFPFLEDSIYVLTFPAQRAALVSSATGGTEPRVSVVGSTDRSLTVEVRV